MNTLKGSILLLLTLSMYIVVALKGAVGCMDNSQHLKKKYDTKAYHYVSCDCACCSTVPGSNKCNSCGHIRIAPTQEIVQNPVQGLTTSIDTESPVVVRNQSSYMKHPLEVLKEMIKVYRAKRK